MADSPDIEANYEAQKDLDEIASNSATAQIPATVIKSPIESLPVEILEIIFHPRNFPLANDPKESYLATTPSKLLSPYLLKVLYHSIRLWSIEEIHLLAEACLNPELGPFIHHLYLPSEQPDREVYEEESMNTIFKSAVNLESSEGDIEFHKILFTKSFGESKKYGQKLEWLILGDLEGDKIINWSNLGYLPVLKKLMMDISSTKSYSGDLARRLMPLEELVIGFCEIKEESNDDSFLTILPTLLPNLTSLSLLYWDDEGDSNFLPILKSFHSSTRSTPSLKDLVLCSELESTVSLESLGQVIATFTSLESLEFDFHVTKDFINSISELENLHHFTKLYGSMDYDEGVLLLSNLKLKSLGINFSVQSGSISTSYQEGAEFVLDERKHVVPSNGWERPIWHGMTRAEAMDLIRRAEEKGVVLLESEDADSVHEAIFNDLAYEKELEWCEKIMKFSRIGIKGFKEELGLV